MTKKFTYVAQKEELSPEQQAARDFLAPLAAKLREVEIIKSGGVRKDTQLFMEGKGREIWRFQNYRFTIDLARPESVNIDVLSTSDSPDSPNQYKDAEDFPELSWVNASSYKGVQTQQGKSCYVYKLGDQTAWIEVATRMPVYYESKAMQISYTYSESNDRPLQLPVGFDEKLAKFKRALRGGI